MKRQTANETAESGGAKADRSGFIGHWQDGDLVQDRQMTWLEAHGGGSSSVGLFLVTINACWRVGVPLGLLYGLVRFVKWAWSN